MQVQNDSKLILQSLANAFKILSLMHIIYNYIY